MLQVSDLAKSYGPDLLFSDVSFSIGIGEKVGLVGRNGHGKTTLFRILVGEESADKGEIRVPKNYHLGYLRQDIRFTAINVVEEVMLALPPEESSFHFKAERILLGLGFSKEDMKKSPQQLSGGFQVRLNLAKVLLSDANLLLLDEPTNYLDIVSLRWLADFLKRWPRELLLITHDRSFMDQVVNSVVGIHRKKVKKITGKTFDFFDQVAQEEEIYEKTRLNAEKKAKDIEEFVQKFRAKARQASLAQSRMKTLAKMDTNEKLQSIAELDFCFTYIPMNGKWPLVAKNLSFGYQEDHLLFQNLSLSLGQQDRLAIIGKNGQGKSTLLNVLAEKLKPLSGDMVWHPQVKTAHFAQTNKLDLQDHLTIEEEIAQVNLDHPYTRVRQICGTMMFEGDRAKKLIRVLSGGEKSRVLLGKILANPCNILLLDEPTHHLDLPSCEALIEGLQAFPGAVILVTHDENFLRAVPNKLVVFQQGGAHYFEGNYEDFLQREGWVDEKFRNDEVGEGVEGKTDKIDYRKSKERRREIIAERSKELKPLKEKIEQCESFIIKSEDEIKVMEKEILKLSESGVGGKKVGELSAQLALLQKKVDESYIELEEVTLEYEEKEKFYNCQLEEIEMKI